jgi:acetyl-CoA synthetase
VITADESKRGGKTHGLKMVVDRAVSECPSISKVLVFRRTGEFNVPMHKGRDVWWHDEMPKMRP